MPATGSAVADSAATLRRQVERLRAECGCTAGGIAALAALSAYVVLVVTGAVAAGATTFEMWLGGAIVVASAALAGKGSAVLLARYRLQRLTRSLRGSALGDGWMV